jgi:two-component system, LytTR family, sensor histidine kinase LytS
LGAGLIAGIHRFTLGGFTGVACGLANIITGVLAGIFHRKNKLGKLRSAPFIVALAETLQMAVNLLFDLPF